MSAAANSQQIDQPLPRLVEEDAEAKTKQTSYRQILKSSALIGGSQVLSIGIGVVRTKAMALMLGPAGFGLFGLYGSILDLTQAVAGMGISSSGVRQIAESVGSGDRQRIARTAAVLRQTSVWLGLIAVALIVLLSEQISTLTFGTSEHAAAVSLLSIAAFFRLVSAGQGALLQGMRRISDLARMGVWGALLGAGFSIPLVFFFREDGVVPSLIAVAAMMIATSWWYARKVDLVIPKVSASEILHESSELLKLGSAFMASGLLMMGSAYVVRIFITRKLGVDSTGLYQSAWTLGGLYLGFILQAMGADFYPRLTAVANNNLASNRLVNEQARVGMLLGVPGVLGTLTFAPLVISLFYSAEFEAAVPVLRWICLGAAVRVVSWPIGFIVIAKNRRALFFWTELVWTLVHLGLAWVLVDKFGLPGAGMAFFGAYLVHALMMLVVGHRISQFRLTVENKQTAVLSLSVISLALLAFYALPGVWPFLLSIVAGLATTAYMIYFLLPMIPADRLPAPVRRAIGALGLVVLNTEPNS